MDTNRVVKHRNIFLVYLFYIITLGFYGWYWIISTKNDINSKGEYHIPTAWIWLIPFVGEIFWMFKYSKGLSLNIRHDNLTWLWFILSILPTGIIMPAIIQSSINKVATTTATAPTQTKPTTTLTTTPTETPNATTPAAPVTA